jgi:hypothetical protein
MAKYQEQINRQGRQHIATLQVAVSKLWHQMCEYDGIPATESFVDIDCFSSGNPYTRFYQTALRQLWQAEADYAAGGYVGLRIGGKRGQIRR